MKNKITKRDLLFFVMGICMMLLITLFWNWKSNIDSFKDGVKDGYNETVKETT